jgi:phosphopantetheinyl transferase (holo-ACP synthase)
MKALGASQALVSLSHERGLAAAVVVIEARGPGAGA